MSRQRIGPDHSAKNLTIAVAYPNGVYQTNLDELLRPFAVLRAPPEVACASTPNGFGGPTPADVLRVRMALGMRVSDDEQALVTHGRCRCGAEHDRYARVCADCGGRIMRGWG